MEDLIFDKFKMTQIVFSKKLFSFLEKNIKQFSDEKKEIYRLHDIENKEKFSFLN